MKRKSAKFKYASKLQNHFILNLGLQSAYVQKRTKLTCCFPLQCLELHIKWFNPLDSKDPSLFDFSPSASCSTPEPEYRHLFSHVRLRWPFSPHFRCFVYGMASLARTVPAASPQSQQPPHSPSSLLTIPEASPQSHQPPHPQGLPNVPAASPQSKQPPYSPSSLPTVSLQSQQPPHSPSSLLTVPAASPQFQQPPHSPSSLSTVPTASPQSHQPPYSPSSLPTVPAASQ